MLHYENNYENERIIKTKQKVKKQKKNKLAAPAMSKHNDNDGNENGHDDDEKLWTIFDAAIISSVTFWLWTSACKQKAATKAIFWAKWRATPKNIC